MKEDDDYCGFACGDIIARQQQILDDINDFSQYNPEYALVMIGKIMEMVYYGKDKLVNGPEKSEKNARVNEEMLERLGDHIVD